MEPQTEKNDPWNKTLETWRLSFSQITNCNCSYKLRNYQICTIQWLQFAPSLKTNIAKAFPKGNLIFQQLIFIGVPSREQNISPKKWHIWRWFSKLPAWWDMYPSPGGYPYCAYHFFWVFHLSNAACQKQVAMDSGAPRVVLQNKKNGGIWPISRRKMQGFLQMLPRWMVKFMTVDVYICIYHS